MNNKLSNDNLSLCRLILYHSVTGFLLSPIEYPNKTYDIWVHGFGMTENYFQIGMIIGDTEEHNKICGLRGGNGLYRRYACRDCLVSTEDADNPDIGCESCKV